MKKNLKYQKTLRIAKGVFIVALLLAPGLLFADVNGEISKWTQNARRIAKSIIGLAAIGGGVIVYQKMQSDDGSSGKKALMSYIGALVFAALLFVLIDEIIK